ERQAFLAAILAQVPESLDQASGWSRPRYGELPACQDEASRGPQLEPEQGPHEFAPSRAHQAGNAEHCAAPQPEAGVFQARWRGEVVHREDHVARMAFSLSGRWRRREGEGCAPDHVRVHPIVARLRDGPPVHAAAIAQDGVATGDLAHFFAKMTD